MENEIWRPVLGYEGDYEVSNLGRVRSIYKVVIKSNDQTYTRVSKILKSALDTKGYVRCALSKIGAKLVTKKVHRLVAESFIPTSDMTLFVNHKNFITTDNTVENLEWVTNKQNVYHSIRAGRLQMKADDALRERSINKEIKRGSLNGCSKLTEEQVLEIRSKYKPNIYTRKMLGEEYGVDHTTIKGIVNRKSWKHV